MWECPARQVGQRPHQRSGITVTGSPADQPVTPSPTAATRPDISCPITPWSGDPVVHVPGQDVQVGAADPDVGHLQLHLTWSGRRCVDLRDLDAAPRDVLRRQHLVVTTGGSSRSRTPGTHLAASPSLARQRGMASLRPSSASARTTT